MQISRNMLEEIDRVDQLRSRGNGRKPTIKQACAKVGISAAIYYRYKSREEHFPAIARDWDALTESFEPVLPEGVFERMSEGEQTDFQHDVSRAFCQVYSKAAPLATSGQLADELEPFAAGLLKLVRCWGDLSPDAKKRADSFAVGSFDGNPDFVDLMEDMGKLAGKFHARLQESRHPLSPSARGRGGRRSDTRHRIVVSALAPLFARVARHEPTAWHHRDDTPGGAFNAFAYGAFRHFLKMGEKAFGDHAVRDAITFMARRFDHGAEIAGVEDASRTRSIIQRNNSTKKP